jgi:uncharacterized protein
MVSNADLHRTMDEALNEGDLDAAREFMADDMVVHLVGDNPFAGDYQGPDGFFDVFQQVADLTAGTFSTEHRDILASEGRSIAITKMSATRAGNTFEGDVVDICLWNDGKVVEEWILPLEPQAFNAFWS